jgi:hypothetical protein
MATALDAIARSTVASARPDARRFPLVPGAAADPQALEAGAVRHGTMADNIDFRSSVAPAMYQESLAPMGGYRYNSFCLCQ